MHRFVPGPLNANELLQRAGFKELMWVSSCYQCKHTKMSDTVLPLMLKRSQSKMERLKKKWQHVEYNRTSLNG